MRHNVASGSGEEGAAVPTAGRHGTAAGAARRHGRLPPMGGGTALVPHHPPIQCDAARRYSRQRTAYHWNLACTSTSSYSSAACSQLRSCCMPRCCRRLRAVGERGGQGGQSSSTAVCAVQVLGRHKRTEAAAGCAKQDALPTRTSPCTHGTCAAHPKHTCATQHAAKF